MTGTLARTDRIDAQLLARMAVALQPPVRPARTPQQNQLAALVNARDELVRDRIALRNRAKNLTVALLKRQCTQRLEQIARHIEALDAKIAITAITAVTAVTAITAVMRKRGVTANALLKADRLWMPTPA